MTPRRYAASFPGEDDYYADMPHIDFSQHDSSTDASSTSSTSASTSTRASSTLSTHSIQPLMRRFAEMAILNLRIHERLINEMEEDEVEEL